MKTYAVLGAGRQGTAAAYDMARHGQAARVRIGDADLAAATRAVRRVNEATGREVAEACRVDAADLDAVRELLEPADACLSAVPYWLNLDVTRIAIEARCHLCDLGGHTGIARRQHELDEEAREAGVAIVPNCGQVPGMGTSFVVHAMEMLDEAEDVFLWDGGVPESPRDPFPYLLTFHVAGLTNEYAEPAVFLRDGVRTAVEPMSELETVEFEPPLGELEAFVTGGGTDTMPWTFEGELRTLQNKTLRHPGHFAQLRAFYDLGLWSLDPIEAGGREVVPRDVFHALFEPKVTFPEDVDLVVIRVVARGRKDGRPAESRVEMIDRADPETGFTSMERCTGWSAAIVAELAALGEIAPGAAGVEVKVPAGRYVEECRRRGLPVRESLRIEP